MRHANRIGLSLLAVALVFAGYLNVVDHRVPAPARVVTPVPVPRPERDAQPPPDEIVRRSRGNGMSLWFGDDVAALVRYHSKLGIDPEPGEEEPGATWKPGDRVCLVDDSPDAASPDPEDADDVILAADHAALIVYHSPVPDEAGRFRVIRELSLARRLFTLRRGSMVRVLTVAEPTLPDGSRAYEVEVNPDFKRGWVAGQFIR